jgi:hypothetical protein
MNASWSINPHQITLVSRYLLVYVLPPRRDIALFVQRSQGRRHEV